MDGRGQIRVALTVQVSCVDCAGGAWYVFANRAEAREKAAEFKRYWVRTPAGWVHRRCFLLRPWREDLQRWMRSHRSALQAGG